VTSGFPAEKIVLHGNAKSPRDLETALRLGVGPRTRGCSGACELRWPRDHVLPADAGVFRSR
ncbi:hypothetical protein ACWEQN_25380, partial [Streptomyces sp. NPDC004129]